MTDPMTPESIIVDQRLAPHPEGGHYREIYRSAETVRASGDRGSRSAFTLIHFLLRRGETSVWHRVLSDESWHWSAGSPLELWIMDPDLRSLHKQVIAPLGTPDSVPAHVVPARWWQAARPVGVWSMMQCAVAPGFDFADFTLLRDDPDASLLVRERFPGAVTLL